MKTLIIDNYDSFTYNIAHYFAELGADTQVVHNDDLSVTDIAAYHADCLVVSPGPCTPRESGVSLDAIACFAPTLPILGVCLGHQCIAQVFGADIVRAKQIMHGKVSPIFHHGTGVFAGLPNPFYATRYHSLVVDKQTLPHCLEITAWTQHEDGSINDIMGIRHTALLVEGVQFHPESILSERGHCLFNNFLMACNAVKQTRGASS